MSDHRGFHTHNRIHEQVAQEECDCANSAFWVGFFMGGFAVVAIITGWGWV